MAARRFLVSFTGHDAAGRALCVDFIPMAVGWMAVDTGWKPTLSGSVEYHGPPRSGHLSFP